MIELLAKESLEEQGLSLRQWEIYPAVVQEYNQSVKVAIQIGQKIFSKKFSKEEFSKVFSKTVVVMAQGKGVPMPKYPTELEIIGNLPLSEHTDKVLHLEDLGEGIMLVYTEKMVYLYQARRLTHEFSGSYFFARGNKKPIEAKEILFEIWNGISWCPWIEQGITVNKVKKKITENYFVIELKNGRTLFYKLYQS